MKKVLIIGGVSTDTEKQTEYAKDLAKLFVDYEFNELRFDQLTISLSPDDFSIVENEHGKEISEYDLVIFRGKIRKNVELAYIISRYLVAKNIPFFNDYSLYRQTSKIAQTVLFYELKVPFIRTIFSINGNLLLKKVEKELSFPIILKDNLGAHGLNNYLAESFEHAKKILEDNPGVKFIAQAYHPNNCDFRILVSGNQDPLVIKRSAAAGSHLNNTSQGGKAELSSDLPAKWLKSSMEIAKTLKMELAGVDLLQDSSTGNFLFLEVNSQPQILSGAFIDEKKEFVKKLLLSHLNNKS